MLKHLSNIHAYHCYIKINPLYLRSISKRLNLMGVTRLKRKGQKNRAKSASRNFNLKHLTWVPVIKNVDNEELKKQFGATKKETKKEEAEAAPKAAKAEATQEAQVEAPAAAAATEVKEKPAAKKATAKKAEPAEGKAEKATKAKAARKDKEESAE